MELDPDTVLTAVYCVVDDLYRPEVSLEFGIRRLPEKGRPEIVNGLSRLAQLFIDMTALVIGFGMEWQRSDGNSQTIQRHLVVERRRRPSRLRPSQISHHQVNCQEFWRGRFFKRRIWW